uniref:WKF domain-containing protein n=1 Tax=Pararge aegeria TaxID=116150 RepID=S4PWV2_9NEOP
MGRNKKKKSEKHNIQQSSEHLDVPESNALNDSHEEGTNITAVKEESRTTDNKIMKRQHDSENSDTEDEPKKPMKKKKVPLEAEEPATGKKNKKSKRQLKREKYAAKLALEQASAKDQTKLQCLNYLSQWKHDKQNWKFMKARQLWLHKNKFSTQLIPEASWPLLLEYFESAQGNIKTILLNDANKIIKQMDEWTESQTNKDAEGDTEQSESTELTKPEETVYNRARSIIQCLQE